jgi:hydrogenase nickel incorporation protein HypA/HybF
MHELAISQEVVELACRRARGARIRRIVLCIGRLSAVLPDAVQFCFNQCTEGTAADGAVLDIVEPPGLAECRACGRAVLLEKPYGVCACGSSDLDWFAGVDLTIQSVEVV